MARYYQWGRITNSGDPVIGKSAGWGECLYVTDSADHLRDGCNRAFAEIAANRTASAAHRVFATPSGCGRWFFFGGGASAYRNAFGIAWSEDPKVEDPAHLPVRFIIVANSRARPDAQSMAEDETQGVICGCAVMLPVCAEDPLSSVLGHDAHGTLVVDCAAEALHVNGGDWPLFAYFFLLQDAWRFDGEAWFVDTSAPIFWASAALNAGTDGAAHMAAVPFPGCEADAEVYGFEDLHRVHWAPHGVAHDFSDIVGCTSTFVRMGDQGPENGSSADDAAADGE